MRIYIKKISITLLICGLIADPSVIQNLAFGSELSHRFESYLFVFQITITMLALLLLSSSNRKISSTIRRTLINITLLYGSLLVPLYGFIGIETLGVVAKYTLLKSMPADRVANDIFRSPAFRQSRLLEDKTFESEYVKSNSQGFRSPPFVPKEEKDNRFIFLGGSTAWGYNVADQNAIPAYLAARIKSVGIEIDAYNLGRNGSTIEQQLAYLNQYVDVLRPDVVILYNGINESPWYGSVSNIEQSGYFNFDFRKQFVDFRQLIRELHGDNFQLEPDSYFTLKLLFALMGMLIGEPELTNEPTNSNSVAEHVKKYVRNHSVYEKLCDEKEISCYTFLQPILVNKKSKTFLESVSHYSRQYMQGSGGYDNFVSRVVNELKQQSLVTTIDLRGVFSDTKTSVFVDYCHLNYVGNSIIADAVFEEIKDDIQNLIR